MQRILALSALCIVIAGCGRQPDADAEPAFWQCADEGGLEFHAVRTEAGMTLTLPGRVVELGATGDGRYARNEIALETAPAGGPPAMTVRVGLDEHRCVPKVWGGPWADAAARGAEFRAVGQEPGWAVEVVPGGDLIAVLDYGDKRLVLPAPEVTPLDGGARGYQAERDGEVVQIVIEPLICFDAMSGQVYPETVTLALGGRRYTGCGKGIAK